MEQEKLGLTGRQKLVYEAVQKIHTGEQMRQEGLIELNNLIPDSDKKTVANRTLRDNSAGFFRNSKKPDGELIDKIVQMIKKGERVTANYLRKRLSISDSHVKRLREKLRGKISEKKVSGAGEAKVWFLAKTKATKTTVKDSAKLPLDPERVDSVLRFLKASEWVTLHKAMKELSMDWYLLTRITRHLESRGLAKSIKKINNPAHKGNSSYGREFTYWVAV